MEKEIVEMIEQRKETRNIDYKAPCAWDSFETKAELAKDIMAFSNTRDGGTLIIGISEHDTGHEIEGMTTDQLRTYDVSDVGNFVNQRCEPAVKFDLQKREYQGKQVVVIQVSEFDRVPIICSKNAQKPNSRDFIFKEGQIFIRTDDAQSKPIQSAEEMNKLLGLAITKKSDELLRSIQRIIRGVPVAETSMSLDELYSKEVQKIEQDFQSTFEDYQGYGFWDFIVYPIEYVERRIGSHQELADKVLDAGVSLRGGVFPYFTPGTDVSNLKNGVRGFTKDTDYAVYELWHIYMSGYFRSRRILMEDLYPGIAEEIPGRTLEYIDTISRVTENLLFAERFFEAIKYEGQIYYRILLGKCQGRKLRSVFRREVRLRADYRCFEKELEHEKQIDFDQFRSLWPEPAIDAIMEMFALFNAEEIPRSVIAGFVNGFLQRRL